MNNTMIERRALQAGQYYDETIGAVMDGEERLVLVDGENCRFIDADAAGAYRYGNVFRCIRIDGETVINANR